MKSTLSCVLLVAVTLFLLSLSPAAARGGGYTDDTPDPNMEGGELPPEAIADDLKCPLCHSAVNYFVRNIASMRRQCALNPKADECENGDVGEHKVIDMLSAYCKEKVLDVFPAITEHPDEHGDDASIESDSDDGNDDSNSEDSDDLLDDLGGDDGEMPQVNPKMEEDMEPIDERFHHMVKQVCISHLITQKKSAREDLIRILMNEAKSPDVRSNPNLDGKKATSKKGVAQYRKDVNKQRAADYEVVARMQTVLCLKQCGEIRPNPKDKKILAWSVRGKFINTNEYDEL